MKKIEMFQTSDGAMYETYKLACSHVDAKYGAALCKIAHDMVTTEGKYHLMLAFIDENLSRFVELKTISDDVGLEIDTED